MSPGAKKRIRIYAFTAGIVIAIMAGIPPLDEVAWPLAVIAILGLIVGILNIRGEKQTNRFLIAAIGLIVVVSAFLEFEGVKGAKTIIENFQIFIIPGLLYVALVGLYEIIKENAGTFRLWLYVAANIIVIIVWIFGFEDKGSKTFTDITSIALLVLGLLVGYFEGPKNKGEADQEVGYRFLISALALQLSSLAVALVTGADYGKLEVLVKYINFLLQKATIFTTSALLVIAFMTIFWVLDQISD